MFSLMVVTVVGVANGGKRALRPSMSRVMASGTVNLVYSGEYLLASFGPVSGRVVLSMFDNLTGVAG
jgi:hypothetical protein